MSLRVKPTIHVAPATRDHIDTLANWQVAMAFESESMGLDPHTVVQGVTKIFDDPTTGFYLLARINDLPVGCCLVLREWSDWRNGDVLWIHSVYTIPSHRRVGVFRSIYSYLKEQVAASHNLRGLRLYVDKGNKEALSTYESLGMTCDHYHLFEWMK